IRDFHVTGVQTCALPIWGVSNINIYKIYPGLKSDFTIMNQLHNNNKTNDFIKRSITLPYGQLVVHFKDKDNIITNMIIDIGHFRSMYVHRIKNTILEEKYRITRLIVDNWKYYDVNGEVVNIYDVPTDDEVKDMTFISNIRITYIPNDNVDQ